MSFRESEIRHLSPSVSEQRPNTYFHLIEKVGDSGKYQSVMLFIFLINWFVTGIILLSTAFLFRNRSFDCIENGLLINEVFCTKYVCQLPSTQWPNYFASDDNTFDSIATDNDYICSDSISIDLVSSCTYFGAFIGYIVISFFSDNFGRKSSILVSWAICTIGTVLVAISFNIYMVAVGLFLSGCGSDATINICFFFFGEVVGDKKRQKYSVIVQIFFTLGAMIVTLFFYLIDNWRIVWCLLVSVPAIIQLVLLYSYIEETPQFLVRKGINEALKALNRIGKINLDRRQTLEEEDIGNVMYCQITSDFQDKYITPIDLCRFSSLRVTTIACCIISFMTYAMYYGPVLIINEIGIDIYTTNVMVQLSELITFLPAFFYIQKISRKSFGTLLFFIAISAAFILSFFEQPDECDFCLQSVVELIIIFVFRSCISFFFCFFQIYVCELFPSRVRGMGVGIVSAFGTLASTSSPLYIGVMRRNGLDVFNFFILFGIAAIGSLTLLDQTKGLPLREQIEQIEFQKQKRRSQISLKSTIRIQNRNHKSQISADRLRSSRMIRSD